MAKRILLNPVDRLILLTDQELRRRGLPGFTCQIHVWFQGRLSISQLQIAITSLMERWPLLTARLVQRPDWSWQPTGERVCSIREITLASDSEDDLIESATMLLAEPFDILQEAPVRFVVQHAPNGNDVLTLQYSHVLMDGHGAIGLMNELLGRRPPALISESRPIVGNQSQSWRQRLQKFRELRAQRQARTIPVTFPLSPEQPPSGRFLLRWIDAEAHRQLQKRIARTGMTANLSLAFIASGVRAVHRQLRDQVGPNRVFETVLRYNTRVHNARHDYFQNQYGRILLAARPDEMDDRDALVRRLASEFRRGFSAESREAFDRGARIAGLISRWAPRFNRWLLRRTVTLTVGTFGEVASVGHEAFGAIIAGGFMHPMPFLQSPVVVDTFAVGERLLACMTYCTTALSEDQARQLFDDWLEDLR